ncbi:MAG TPA: glycosyltransferase [Thermoanaerobaculia bacterium]
MKILYCIPTLEIGGAERQLSYLATEMLRHGHDVHVASVRGGENRERLEEAGVVLHDLAGSGKKDFRVVPKLVGLMRALKADVVQTTLARMDVAGGSAALYTRTPWILREASSAPEHADDPMSWIRRLLARRADAIVSNSQNGDDYWRSVARRKRHVIRNGVPFAEFAAGPPQQAPHTPTILFAGRLDEGKNVATLIHALGRLAGQLEFTALIAGDGSLREELQRLATACGIAHRVSFIGTQPTIVELLRRADLAVSLSRWEGCPNFVLEAMASGAPLVLSDIPAHRELLDERGARFVPAQDAVAAAEAILTTLRSAGSGRERNLVAREMAAARSIESMAARYAEIYDAVRLNRRVASGARRKTVADAERTGRSLPENP